MNPRFSASTVAAALQKQIRISIKLPLPIKYRDWLWSVAQGDAGFSLAYNSPAAPIILLRARNTLALTGISTLLAWLIALPFGMWSAARPGKILDTLARGAVSHPTRNSRADSRASVVIHRCTQPFSSHWRRRVSQFLRTDVLGEVPRSPQPSGPSEPVPDSRCAAGSPFPREGCRRRSARLPVHRRRCCARNSASPLALSPRSACGRQSPHFSMGSFLGDSIELLSSDRGCLWLARAWPFVNRGNLAARCCISLSIPPCWPRVSSLPVTCWPTSFSSRSTQESA